MNAIALVDVRAIVLVLRADAITHNRFGDAVLHLATGAEHANE